MRIDINHGGIPPELSYSSILYGPQASAIMNRINAIYGGRLRVLVSDVWDSRDGAWGWWIAYSNLSSYIIRVSEDAPALVCSMAFLMLNQGEVPDPIFYMKVTTTNLAGTDSDSEESKAVYSALTGREEVSGIGRGEMQNPGEGIPSNDMVPLVWMDPTVNEPIFATSRTQKITFSFKMERDYLSIQPFAFWVYEMPREEII